MFGSKAKRSSWTGTADAELLGESASETLQRAHAR